MSFISFDRLIGATLIKTIYYIGLIVMIAGPTYALYHAIDHRLMEEAAVLAAAIIFVLPIAIITWRFISEIQIVIFNIHERLCEIRDKNQAASITRAISEDTQEKKIA